MISLLLVRKIVQLFLIMILGYVMVRLKVVKTEESVVLSKISLYLIMPAVILSAFQVDFKQEIREGLMLAFVAAVAIHILLLVIDGSSRTCLGAYAAFLPVEESAVLRVNGVDRRYSLGVIFVYRLSEIMPEVVFIRNLCRTFLSAGAT